MIGPEQNIAHERPLSDDFDALILLTGMILPFPLVVGIFVAVILTSVIGNPILQSYGWFEHWSPGNGLLVNQMILSFDFWMSVTCGLAITVAVVGLATVFRKKENPLPPAPFLYRGRGSRRPTRWSPRSRCVVCAGASKWARELSPVRADRKAWSASCESGSDDPPRTACRHA